MVTFVIRDFPDLDHLFPVINVFLKKKVKVNILNFEINLNLEKDPKIDYLLKNYQNNLHIYEVYNIKGKRFLIDNIIKFLSSSKFKDINFKNLKNLKKKNSIIYFFYLLVICYFKKIIFSSKSRIEKYLFNKNWAKNIFEKINITSLVIDDSYYFNFSRPRSLIEVCKLNNVKITLMPHTCHMFTRKEDIDNLKSKDLDKFYPNVIVTSDKMKKIFNNCGIDKSKIINLGSARFSSEHINLLNTIYPKKNTTEIDLNINNKIKVLYIDGSYDNTNEKINLINNVSKLNNIELVVKAHPRGMFLKNQLSSKQKKLNKNTNSNFIIDISTPTKKLIDNHDLILGTYSSILVEAMLSHKKIILPKFLLKDHIEFEIFYEEFGFAKICYNVNEVTSYINSYSKKHSDQNFELIEGFINEYVYGGRKNSSNILNEYYNLIK